MLLWITFFIMTAAALGALLWPVWSQGEPEPPSGDAELAVYRDQLSEIALDAESGLIETEDALATRNEVSRRILSAAAPDAARQASPTPGARRTALLISTV